LISLGCPSPPHPVLAAVSSRYPRVEGRLFMYY
jgi:hypothetical protein